ncbi:MAG: hypothetical protein JKY09_03670 [Crocinitomicaceae bacterium]|nr:hypothetical protein [Crocinitomicaceae bacterium]
MNVKRACIFILALVFLGLCALLFVRFLAFHEIRASTSGIVFKDPLFPFLPIGDFSTLIFSLTYGSLILFVFSWRKIPYAWSKLMMAYGLLLLFRILTLSILPLEIPEDLVYLQDPFLNNLMYPGDIKADLFFSGHTGLLLMLFFLSRKWVYIVMAMILGYVLMVQRVHYSIDIIAALPFAYLIVVLVELIVKKLVRDQ